MERIKNPLYEELAELKKLKNQLETLNLKTEEIDQKIALLEAELAEEEYVAARLKINLENNFVTEHTTGETVQKTGPANFGINCVAEGKEPFIFEDNEPYIKNFGTNKENANLKAMVYSTIMSQRGVDMIAINIVDYPIYIDKNSN